MASVGEVCPSCGKAQIKVLNTRPSESEGVRVRWLGCGGCGFRPPDNKQVVPLKFAPRRMSMRPRLDLRRR